MRDAVKPIIGSPPDAREHAGWPVVADAETLLRDAGKASRHERRTILVNLAGNGTIRLFCARHVLDEVARQAARYSGRVPVDAFIRRWEADYLPHLNLVDPAAGLLDPGEERRVARLDSPDSAVLALQLGAFFLSTDEPALRAVYGPDADLRRHGEWVAVLGSAGDTGGELLRSVSGVSELAGRGGVAGVKWVWNNVSPWAVAGIAAVAGFSLWTATPEDRRRILRGAGAVAGFVGGARRRAPDHLGGLHLDDGPRPGLGRSRAERPGRGRTRPCVPAQARAVGRPGTRAGRARGRAAAPARVHQPDRDPGDAAPPRLLP